MWRLGDAKGLTLRGALRKAAAEMSVQGVIRWFLPREDQFYDFLERQAAVAHEGVKAFARLKEPGASSKDVREAVQALEHEGDKIVHEFEEALARTFVTPIDRED